MRKILYAPITRLLQGWVLHRSHDRNRLDSSQSAARDRSGRIQDVGTVPLELLKKTDPLQACPDIEKPRGRSVAALSFIWLLNN